jgi:hypothetical protein
VDSWTCLVTNQHRRIHPVRRIRQRTIIHLRGRVHDGVGSGETAGVYLTFEKGAQDLTPTVAESPDPAERLRIDVYLRHGQEAAVLAILQSGFRAWARYSETALGQPMVVLESGPEPEPAPGT